MRAMLLRIQTGRCVHALQRHADEGFQLLAGAGTDTPRCARTLGLNIRDARPVVGAARRPGVAVPSGPGAAAARAPLPRRRPALLRPAPGQLCIGSQQLVNTISRNVVFLLPFRRLAPSHTRFNSLACVGLPFRQWGPKISIRPHGNGHFQTSLQDLILPRNPKSGMTSRTPNSKPLKIYRRHHARVCAIASCLKMP